MYIEFNEDEKKRLVEAGFTEGANKRYIHSDTCFEEFFLEIKKLPNESVEVTIHFSDGEDEMVPFPTFDSFFHITNITLGRQDAI